MINIETANKVWKLATQIATANPANIDRAERAALLVVEDEVKPIGAVTFHVHGYTVDMGELTCQCPDFRHNQPPLSKAGHRYCKHLLAAAICLRLHPDEQPTVRQLPLSANFALQQAYVQAAMASRTNHPYGM